MNHPYFIAALAIALPSCTVTEPEFASDNPQMDKRVVIYLEHKDVVSKPRLVMSMNSADNKIRLTATDIANAIADANRFETYDPWSLFRGDRVADG